jgi:hypothetical protein
VRSVLISDMGSFCSPFGRQSIVLHWYCGEGLTLGRRVAGTAVGMGFVVDTASLTVCRSVSEFLTVVHQDSDLLTAMSKYFYIQ